MLRTAWLYCKTNSSLTLKTIKLFAQQCNNYNKALTLAIFYVALLIPTFPVLGSEVEQVSFATKVIDNAKKNTIRITDKSEQILMLSEIAELEYDLISHKAAKETLQKITQEVISLTDATSRSDAWERIINAYLYMKEGRTQGQIFIVYK